jgi:poly(A) polymerase
MDISLALKIRHGPEIASVQIRSGALSILKEIEPYFSERKIEAYLVGGFVRDILINRSTADIDLAIAADALKVAREVADALGGKFVLLDEANRIARVVLPTDRTSTRADWYIDLSTLEKDIHQDLRRRDFTIDAMAVDLESFIRNPDDFEIIDPLGGRRDTELRLISAVSETNFEADPARLLRAVRLAAELNFNITAETEALMRQFHLFIGRVAGERVREELLRILNTHQAGRYIRYLDDLRLLTTVIPELEPSRGLEQPKEHHWDVLNHSLQTVRAVEFLLRQGQWEYAPEEILESIPWSEKLSQHFAAEVGSGSTHASLLKLAALFHDIAKPETKIIANDRVRFFGHNERGAEKVVEVLSRLRFSNKEINLVEMMVRAHLRPTQMSHEGKPTKRAIYRYFRDTGTASIDILFLSLADHLAARGPDLNVTQWKQQAEQAKCLLTDCFQQDTAISPPKLVDGHDLISMFGLKPGPLIREILEEVRESQAAGELLTREAALSYIRNRLLYIEQK